MQEKEATLKDLKEKHLEEVIKRPRKYQEKKLFLLRQMPHTRKHEGESNSESDVDILRVSN